MSKKAKVTDTADQPARFIETARALETNDDPAAFDELFGKLAPPIVPKPKADKKRETE